MLNCNKKDTVTQHLYGFDGYYRDNKIIIDIYTKI